MKRTAQSPVILIATCITSFLPSFMGSSVNIVLPLVADAFSLDAVLTNWVATSYLITTAMFLLPLGRAADVLGRKRVYASGIAVFTLTSLAAAVAP